MQRRAFLSSTLTGAVAVMLGPRSGYVDLDALAAGPARLRAAAQQSLRVSPANAERYVRALTQLVPKVPSSQRRHVVAIAVDATAAASNLAYDHDRPDRSAAMARTAHSLATEVGDDESAALMTARMSSALVKLDRPDVALATLDRVRLDDLPPHVSALIEVHRAGACGTVGNGYDALAALDRAEAALAASDPAARPAWARHWTGNYLRNWQVLTLGRLGRHQQAESVVETALATLPERHARVRAHLLLCLGEITARRDAPVEAATHAAAALALTPPRADRFTRRARQLRGLLAVRYGDDPAVLDALAVLDEALTRPLPLHV